MKRVCLALVLLGAGVLLVACYTVLTVRMSGQSFVVDGQHVVVEFGYSHGGDRLRYAVVRSWPMETAPAVKMRDPRRAAGFLGWTLVRDPDGRMIPVGTSGDVYFFEGDKLKTLRVAMNEHDDTIGLGNAKSLGEV